MRLGFGLQTTATRGRSSLSLLLGGTALPVIARLWSDADTWNDNLSWSNAL